MSEISLTASMRSNLLSLQNTASLMDQTQERLSTGKKVNSAIDNPSSYYTAQSLTNRASDLSGLLDSMGQAISTIKAADEGIEAITSFVEQAKAVANSALETKDAAERVKYMDQYNNIRDQIDQLAKDSGYKGVNLINGDSLTVTFNEDRSSNLVIEKQDATTTGLKMTKAAAWDAKVEKTAGVAATAADLATYTLDEDGKLEGTIADKAVFSVGTGDNIKYYQAKEALTADDGTMASIVADSTKAVELTVVKNTDGTVKSFHDTAAGNETITNAVNAATDAINSLRTMASELGNNFSIVETRESFTENLVNVLEEGADKLTLADMNEESANMLALQTRQQLAINSLSLASQAAQSVLSLF